jgi:hypothetical protein
LWCEKTTLNKTPEARQQSITTRRESITTRKED